MTDTGYFVNVIDRATRFVVQRIGPIPNLLRAVRTETGMLGNLDPERFHSEIVFPIGAPDQPLVVGDVVEVGRATLGNPEGARAIVVEVYDLGRRPGYSLLFENGNHDGFAPDELRTFGVVRVEHWPAFADYRFRNAIKLHADWQAGTFAPVWRKS